jgi:hypothetical protein
MKIGLEVVVDMGDLDGCYVSSEETLRMKRKVEEIQPVLLELIKHGARSREHLCQRFYDAEFDTQIVEDALCRLTNAGKITFELIGADKKTEIIYNPVYVSFWERMKYIF